MSNLFRTLALGFAACSLATAAQAVDVTGAGSSFALPIVSKWSSDYSAQSGDKINYQSVGSGAGIAQIKAATVDFGASDKPLAPAELDAAGLGQFPLVIGGVVPVVHLAGVGAGQIRFTGPLLAEIFLGKVTKWNDPAIKRINPRLKLPDAAITVVHRSDGSGTTFNFVHYLGQVSPAWSAVGEGTSVKWPVGVGGKGNEGVAAYVNQIDNSIGYVEYAYVVQNKMNYGVLQNAAGKYIAPSPAAFQAAASTANWAAAKDFYLVMTNAPGPNAYPITATTFVILYKQPKDAARSAAAMKYFRWALENGQSQAAALDYVALPPALVKRVESYWASTIK